MSAVAHTPAPWAMAKAVEADGSITFDIFNDAVYAVNGVGGGVVYLQTIRTYSATRLAEQEANARLVAAAPELLEFAKEWLGRQGSDANYMTAKARAVIAKATEVTA